MQQHPVKSSPKKELVMRRERTEVGPGLAMLSKCSNFMLLFFPLRFLNTTFIVSRKELFLPAVYLKPGY
jgi:hypothetical protein